MGMSLKQYQRLEAHGNPRLEKLEQIARLLKLELVLVPHEHAEAVKALIADRLHEAAKIDNPEISTTKTHATDQRTAQLSTGRTAESSKPS